MWSQRLLLLSIFLLPWQTLWIFSVATIGGTPVPYGRFSLYGTQILLLLAAALRGRAEYRVDSRFVIQGGFFILAAEFFSLAFTPFFKIGLAHALQLVFAFVLLSLLLDMRTDLKRVAFAFISGLVISAGLGFWQVIIGSSSAATLFGLSAQHAADLGTAVVETTSGRMLRAYGSFPHPNIFGGYLAVSLLTLGWLLRFMRTRLALWVFAIPVVILVSAFILTFSRGTWLAFAIASVVLFVQMGLYRRLPSRRAIGMIGLGAITVFSIAFLFNDQIFARLTAHGRIETISIIERTSQYADFRDLFLSHPIFGVGAGGYVFALSRVHPGGQAFNYQPVHNAFALVAGELGLVGLAAVLYLIFCIARLWRTSKKTAGGIFSLSLGATLIVISLFDHYLFSLWPGLALVVLVIAFIVQWSQTFMEQS
ncbi:O-antigen ligase family protein [Candidatus Uhrbacteria bacterium]|nr:O-antigen ligase family protein [Candidatus Uhrbacteria bacterium]